VTDRFDFEQQIMKCWGITEELNLLNKCILEKDMSKDEISNFVLGLETIYEHKFQELFDQFEYLIKEKKL
jgi:hypothetical protein